MDEARNWRDRVACHLKQLSGELILTSRPFGYHKAGLEALPHFEILPLSVEDVDQSIKNWLNVLSRQREADSFDINDRVSWLKGQLKDRPRIRKLTQNPLLLTFLMVLAGEDPRQDLPFSRAELYRRYVEELFSSWETHRRSKNKAAKNQGFNLGDLTDANRFGKTDAVPHLIPLLKDSKSSVRASAANALINFGKADAIPHPISLLKDSKSSV